MLNPNKQTPEFPIITCDIPGLSVWTFNHRQYVIRHFVNNVEHNANGYCDRPGISDRHLLISPNIRGWRLLEVCIHEGLHAAFPKMAESTVGTVARDLMTFYRCMMEVTDRPTYEAITASEKRDGDHA